MYTNDIGMYKMLTLKARNLRSGLIIPKVPVSKNIQQKYTRSARQLLYTPAKLCHIPFVELLTGQLLALATAFCWAQNSLIYAHVGTQVSSSTTAHIRLWIAFPLIMIVHLLFEGSLLPLDLPLKAFLLISVSGLLGFFVADLFIFSSLVALGARRTMVIMTLSPIFGALFSWTLYNEQLLPLQIFGILTTIAGVLWVILADGRVKGPSSRSIEIRGAAAAFGGAVTQALAMVLAKAGMADQAVSSISANSIRIGAGLVGLILFALIRRTFLTDFGRFTGKAGKKALQLIMLAAIVGPVLGIILNLQALKMAPVGVVTTLAQTTPIILLPIEIYFMKRPVSRSAILGTVIAIGGTALLFLPAA
jgi:drug/metabolite transporter (DMT)-like permease